MFLNIYLIVMVDYALKIRYVLMYSLQTRHITIYPLWPSPTQTHLHARGKNPSPPLLPPPTSEVILRFCLLAQDQLSKGNIFTVLKNILPSQKIYKEVHTQKLLAQLLSKYKSDIITTSTSHGDAMSVCLYVWSIV